MAAGSKGNQQATEPPPRLCRGLLSLGILFILTGITYFLAHYWKDLANSDKQDLIAGAVLTSLAVATWAGSGRLLGKLLLLGASALVGAYIGVFGQIYQSGADSYQMFAWWALLIIPWVVLGRFTPLLIFCLGLFNLALILYWPSSFIFTPLEGHLVFRCQTISLVLLNGTALLVREWASRQQLPWLDHGWSALVLLTSIIVPASLGTISEITSNQWEIALTFCALYLALALPLALYYSRRYYALPALAIILMGASAVLTSLIACSLNLSQSFNGWLDSGLGVLVLFSGTIAFLGSRRLLGGIEKITEHRSDPPSCLPLIVSIGAWLLSLLVITFAAVLVGPQYPGTIKALGLTLLIFAVVAGRQKWGLFAGQCALAASLAGQLMIYSGFADGYHHLPLVQAATLSVSLASLLYLTYPNFLSRLSTCFIALQLVLAWIYADQNGHFSTQLDAQPHLWQLIPLYWALHLAAIYWCLLRSRAPEALTPLGLALIGSAAVWQLGNLSNILPQPAGIITYFQTAITALALFSIAFAATGGMPALRTRASLFAGLALALSSLAWLGSGEPLLALLVILLGLLLQDRAVIGLGVLLFLIALVFYPFTEPAVLIASGIVILLLRTALSGSGHLQVLKP